VIRDADSFNRAKLNVPSSFRRLIDLHETIWEGDFPLDAFKLLQAMDVCGKLSAKSEELGLDELSTDFLHRGAVIARLLSESYADAERELLARGRRVPEPDVAALFAAVPATLVAPGQHPARAIEELWLRDSDAALELEVQVTATLRTWLDDVAPISAEGLREFVSRVDAEMPKPLSPQTLLGTVIEPLAAELSRN
jgi:hypothetical protein